MEVDTILHRLQAVRDANQLAPDEEHLLNSAIAELESLKLALSTTNRDEHRTHVLDVVMRICWFIFERYTE